MIDWDKLRNFHVVAECLNMAQAGIRLEVSASAVSRQIASLERGLGCRLFYRHARGLSLTEQGVLLHRTVEKVIAQLKEAEALVSDSSMQPEGTLRVACLVSLGSDWLAPRLGSFLDMYPEIRIVVGDETNLLEGGADLAISYTEPQQASIVRRRLLDFELGAYASPKYLAQRGTPQTVEDLDAHRLIVCRQCGFAGHDWILTAGRPERSPRTAMIELNNTFAARRAASLGAGIATVPDFMARDRTDLVRILENLPNPKLDVWLAWPEAMRGNRRLEVFVEFLVAEAHRGPGSVV